MLNLLLIDHWVFNCLQNPEALVFVCSHVPYLFHIRSGQDCQFSYLFSEIRMQFVLTLLVQIVLTI